MTVDHLVVLHSVGQAYATKRFTLIKNKKTGEAKIRTRNYGSESHFRVEEVAVNSFAEMGAALDRLERDPFAFIIRGEPLPGINRRHARRLLHPDRKSGAPATFKAAERHWIPLDFDHLPAPPLTDVVSDPGAAIQHLIGLLPPEFHDVSCRCQFTSSQGLPGSEGLLSARLWYWSRRPLSDAELTRWAAFVNRNGRILDAAVFRAVQPIYVARPLFEGMPDPLPSRSGRWEGLEDEVEVIIPPPDQRNPERVSERGYEPGIGTEAWLAKIGGPDGFRSPILSAIASYVAIHGSQADLRPLYAAIRKRLDKVEPSWRVDPNGQRYADDGHLDKITQWVRTIHGDQPPKDFTPEPPPGFDDPPPGVPVPELPPPRPIVRTGGGRLAEAIDKAEAVLIATGTDVYVFGDQVVRPALRPIQIADDKETVGLRLVPVGPDHIVDRFTRIIDFRKYSATKDDWVPIDCPLNIAKSYLARTGLWKLPQITALTSCPILLPGGRILDKPGYDPKTGILFDTQGIEFPSVPRQPSKDQAVAALELLMKPFAEFPFVDEASKSVLRSLLLTTVSRLAFPFAPCHAFSATGMGTGKSKIFDCASILQTGRECEVVSQAQDEVEFEKKLFSFFLAGGGLVSIDNCELPLKSPFLCMISTQRFVQSRLLGLSKNATIPTTAIVGANGNNFSYAGDMLRRGLTGRLDAGMERPWERTFHSPDPIHVFKRNRPQLVTAALTVPLAYLEAGQPRQKAPPLGGFEGWARLVRDALLWLGFADPCTTIEVAHVQDPARQKHAAVLMYWQRALATRSLTARAVIAEAVANYPELCIALLDVAEIHGEISPARLGQWLGYNKEKPASIPNGQDKTCTVRLVADTGGALGRWRLQQRQEDGRWL